MGGFVQIHHERHCGTNKLDYYFEIEKDFKHQIKVGVNGDAFCFDMSLQNTYEDDAEDELSFIAFEYESDELSEWLQKFADRLPLKGELK